jgi:protein KTI12
MLIRTRVAQIHAVARQEQVVEWNRTRPEGARYTDEQVAALCMRFETPNDAQRWDRPLFTLLPEDELPFGAIEDALFERAPVPVHLALHTVPRAAADTVNNWDAVTQDICQAILQGQSDVGGRLPVPHASVPVDLPGKVTHGELRRMRMQFLTMTARHNQLRGSAAAIDDVGNRFVQFVNASQGPTS